MAALHIRQADERDRVTLVRWLDEEMYVHRHLDWRPPLDWLGHPFYWLLEAQSRPLAVLACPDDPPEIAWVRLFACTPQISLERAWKMLWQRAREVLSHSRLSVGVIAVHHWIEPLLQEARFRLHQSVVLLEWQRRGAPPPNAVAEAIRPMRASDLGAVAEVDWQAFAPLWRHSRDSLWRAFSQALVASVLEIEGRILGYLIATGSPFGVHLARLAVHPQVQGRGWGRKLVEYLFVQLERRRIDRLTVNTQHDNRASLALYRRLGFQRTGEEYPVYLFDEWR